MTPEQQKALEVIAWVIVFIGIVVCILIFV